MNKMSVILSAIMMLALVVVLAPGILAMNRGKVLRNIALWLAAFAGLGLIYQSFGPGSPHPLFSLPDSMAHQQPLHINAPKTDDDNRGYTPPRE